VHWWSVTSVRRPRSEEGTTRWFPPRAPPSRATGRGAMAPVPCAALDWTAQGMGSPQLRRHRVDRRHGIGAKRVQASSRAGLLSQWASTLSLGPRRSRCSRARRYCALAAHHTVPLSTRRRRIPTPGLARRYARSSARERGPWDRREPRMREREGETTASEWSFPRMGCRGGTPRSARRAIRRQRVWNVDCRLRLWPGIGSAVTPSA